MTLRRCLALVALVSLAAVSPLLAQSQSINGTIEGTVRDTTGAVVPGVTVTALNVDTGLERTLATDTKGGYKAVLLPLGAYQVTAELSGFKKMERFGINLSAGRTAVVNFTMEVGGLEEVVSVTAEAPIADPGKIDLGRTINQADVQNLPLVARNPYNFALIQPNVTGYENVEFGATRMNANGTQMRTQYQLDGANTTQKNRAGLRMFQPSEVMVKEVTVVTSGFAPEFGQTTGMVFNMVTPSGTNSFNGHAGYRFRRTDMSARPFILQEDAEKPDTKIDNFTFTLGGPIVQDKWHFYVGYERLRRDLSQSNISTIRPEDAAALDLTADQTANGTRIATANQLLLKLDGQLSNNHRVSARWGLFVQDIPSTGGGGTGTREVTELFQDRMDTASVQLISNFGANRLNELRIGWGKRDNPRTYELNTTNVLPHSVSIDGVVSMGGAARTPSEFIEKHWQVVDNFTWITGRHTLKVGFDVQFIEDSRLNSIRPSYRFATIEAYTAARDGIDPFSYSSFSQQVGDPTVEYKQKHIAFFVQDDFRITPNFKLLYGVRYDLATPPDADANAPHPYSRSFRTDRNNIGPRIGFSWSLDDAARTVLRGSTGIMYEPPLGRIYEDAFVNAGTARYISASLRPGDDGAPAYPGTLASLPPGEIPPQPSIETVNPDLDNPYTWLSNVQLERALTDDVAVAVGFVNSTGRSIPAQASINYLPSASTLPDGRTLFDRSTRVWDQFNRVKEVRSTGKSQYNAITVSLNKRMSHGFQAQASYTWAKAKDHGQGGGMVVGSIDREGLSDPLNSDLDYSYAAFDTRHTFIASTVIAPESDNPILDNNQLGLIVQYNSGLPFNIRSNRDLNLDGLTNDRPNGIARNSGNLGRVLNVDARYSRFIPLGDRLRAELFVEAKNLFNTESISNNNEVIRTDSLGNPDSPLPGSDADYPITGYYQSRQFQVAMKIHF